MITFSTFQPKVVNFLLINFFCSSWGMRHYQITKKKISIIYETSYYLIIYNFKIGMCNYKFKFLNKAQYVFLLLDFLSKTSLYYQLLLHVTIDYFIK